MGNSNNKKQSVVSSKKSWILAFCILLSVIVLTIVEIKIVNFDSNFPLSSAVLMFTLININLLLLLSLIVIVFRNLAKAFYKTKNKFLGSNLKRRLIISFILLALAPTIILFYFSIQFISISVAFWFNAPVEQTLKSSLSVGQKLYEYVEERNEFFAKRAAFQIVSRKLLNENKAKQLNRYVQVIQRAFDLDAVEIYTPDAKRLSLSLSKEFDKDLHFGILTNNDLISIPDNKKTNTISQTNKMGELLRTVSGIPFGVEPKKAKAFIVITSLVSQELSKDLHDILQGTQEYQQLKLSKQPAQISLYIALTIVALLIIFCAIWFGIHLAKSITDPIKHFADGTKRVSDGDLNYQIDFSADDEIGTLIKSFNLMTKELAAGRKKIALSEKQLKEQNKELEKSRQYIEIVLENVSAGVIAIDKDGIVTTFNKAAELMLNIDSREVLKKNIATIFTPEYKAITNKLYKHATRDENLVDLSFSLSINGVPKYFSLNLNSLKDSLGNNIGNVMVFDDVTALEKAQRTAAWREVARRIAHEVKNPLTPIKLSAERIQRKYGKHINDKLLYDMTNTIIERVNLIKNLIDQFVAFAKFPEANIIKCRIEDILLDTIGLYKDGFKQVSIKSNIAKDLPLLKLEKQHIKQVFINLIDNAIYAINKNGIIVIDVYCDKILNIIRIEIADNGKGISDKNKTKLFEPYFTTKESGMGLGLAIVNSIISDHKGVIRAQNNKPVGTKFIIELPI